LINNEKTFWRKIWKKIIYLIFKNEIWRKTPPEKGFEYKKSYVKTLGERHFFFVPGHWRKELFFLNENREIKIYFWKNKEPITIVFSKETPTEFMVKGFNNEITIDVVDFLVAGFIESLSKNCFKIHSDRLFEYDYLKSIFVPKQYTKSA